MRRTIDMKPIEISHLFVYRAVAYRDGGEFQLMYNDLKKNKEIILDTDIWNELMFKAS